MKWASVYPLYTNIIMYHLTTELHRVFFEFHRYKIKVHMYSVKLFSNSVILRGLMDFNFRAQFTNQSYFLGNQGMNELVLSIYSLYCGFLTFKLFSRRPTPETLMIITVIRNDPRTGR
jgi:hypothetical protein